MTNITVAPKNLKQCLMQYLTFFTPFSKNMQSPHDSPLENPMFGFGKRRPTLTFMKQIHQEGG